MTKLEESNLWRRIKEYQKKLSETSSKWNIEFSLHCTKEILRCLTLLKANKGEKP